MNTYGEISISLLRPNNKVFGFVAAAVLLIFGGIVVFYAAAAFGKAKESLQWTPVEGVVLSAVTHVPGEGPDYLTVQYSYRFNGVTLRGDRICFGMRSIGEKRLKPLGAG